MKKSLVVSIFCRMFASQFIPILGTCRQKCLISQNVLGAVTLIQNAAPFLNFEYQQVMEEQTFIIDGKQVTILSPTLISEEEANRWYKEYPTTSCGEVPLPDGWKSLGGGVFGIYQPKVEPSLWNKMIAINDDIREPPYITHTQEQERQSIEDYVEYCKYAQKLQTELSEGSIFIQDELDYIALELAGIEEERIDLSAREGDLHRQIAYLKTLQSLTNKRKSDLNREYVEVAKERDTSESGDAGGVKMDNQQGDIRNDG